MNALSGLDPKYIDEAAFELHGKTVSFADAKKARSKKALYIALPAVAAAVLFLGVAIVMPTISCLNKGESASMAESTAPAPAAEAEAPAFADEVAEAPAFEEEAASEAPAYAEEAASEEPAFTEEATDGIPAMTELTYVHRILFVKTAQALPDNIDTLKYTITGTDDGAAKTDSQKTYASGTLGEIITGLDPLMLDITEADLPEGTYTLTIGNESMEFDVER